jgi:hypothetical protein
MHTAKVFPSHPLWSGNRGRKLWILRAAAGRPRSAGILAQPQTLGLGQTRSSFKATGSAGIPGVRLRRLHPPKTTCKNQCGGSRFVTPMPSARMSLLNLSVKRGRRNRERSEIPDVSRTSAASSPCDCRRVTLLPRNPPRHPRIDCPCVHRNSDSRRSTRARRLPTTREERTREMPFQFLGQGGFGQLETRCPRQDTTNGNQIKHDSTQTTDDGASQNVSRDKSRCASDVVRWIWITEGESTEARSMPGSPEFQT